VRREVKQRRDDQRLGFSRHMTVPVPLAATGLRVWTLEALGLDTVHAETLGYWVASLGAWTPNYWVVCMACHWLGGI
jgi:energy-converting hydrogenase Eha subunit A